MKIKIFCLILALLVVQDKLFAQYNLTEDMKRSFFSDSHLII
jgi:hypothetical protein